jgi:L-fuculose-phosphate aldolase
METNVAKSYLVQISHQLYHNGLVPGKSGNVSLKACEKGICKVIITPSGFSLKDVTPETLVVVDMQGNRVECENKPSSELEMHLKIYRKRKDVGAVVHIHSPYAVGFSHSDQLIPRLEGFGKIKDPYIKMVEYAPPGSGALAEIASNGLKEEDGLILKNHGVLAVGVDLDEAVLLAEFIESSAKTGFVAHSLSREPILTHSKHSR